MICHISGTLPSAVFTQWRMLLKGGNNFDEIITANRLLGPLLLLTYGVSERDRQSGKGGRKGVGKTVHEVKKTQGGKGSGGYKAKREIEEMGCGGCVLGVVYRC